MNTRRDQISTGLLVFITLGIFVTTLIYLGRPGTLSPQNTYWVYFDNAAGLKPGALVTLGGRKIGQVQHLYSPVPENERPRPKSEILIQVQVAASALIYRDVQVWLAQPRLLGDPIIDFINGQETSGRAPDGTHFQGERPPSFSEAVPQVLERLDPVLEKATATLNSLQTTADRLSKLTAEGADFPEALGEFRQLGVQLNELTGRDGPLRHSLENVENLTRSGGKLDLSAGQLAELTSPHGALARTLANAERFSARLNSNQDIEGTLRNFRSASEKLNGTIDEVGNQFSAVGSNLEQASDTVKRQPWRLIWPTTKRYDERPPPPVAARPGPAPRRPPAPTPIPRRPRR